MSRKKKFKRLKGIALLPTMLTLGNGISGFAAMVAASDGNFLKASWLIFLGMFFDAMDGTAARMVKSSSIFGMQLDSLCDVITFGAAPSFLLFKYMDLQATHIFPHKILWLISAMFLSCAILRLAKFNIDQSAHPERHDHFTGLPTPGAAGALVSLILFQASGLPSSVFFKYDIISRILPFASIIIALLMISKVKYMHIGSRLFQMNYKFTNLLEVILIAFLVALEPERSLCFALVIYVLSGPVLALERTILPEKFQNEARGTDNLKP